jgi:hypothetical protein
MPPETRSMSSPIHASGRAKELATAKGRQATCCLA